MGTRVSFTEEEEAGRALRKLRIRLVGRSSNEWLALYGNLQNFQRHLEESTIWLYREPVRIRVGEKVWETGTQPALHNGEFRILLTDPDSDMPTWNYDVERFLPLSKDSRYRSLAGEQVEVELLPSTVAREVAEVGRKIVDSAPVVQPMSPAAPVPPETPVRKCPACGAELEKDVIGLVCFCGANLPDDLAVSHVFAVALSHTWEQLPDHQRGRISAAFRRGEGTEVQPSGSPREHVSDGSARRVGGREQFGRPESPR